MRRLTKNCYLIVGAKKNGSHISGLTQPRVVSSRTPPTTKGNEVAIKLTVELPESLFKDPQFTASISVANENVSKPQIDAKVIDKISQIVGEATGLTLKIESEIVDET